MPDSTRQGVAHEKYQRLVKAAQGLPTIKVAIAHPCDDVSLQGAIEAARLQLVEPILVGPVERIRGAARAAGLDIDALEIIASEHSHDSAAKAVGLVTAGRAEALMKGSLHTDELMGAVVAREAGIRTARRISHCFIMDVPNHPDALIVTDAAVNIAPTLDDKVDIVQNAIDLAHAMGVTEVRVALLSAMETVTAKVPSTIEAAALCKMAIVGRSPAPCLMGRWRWTTRSVPRLPPSKGLPRRSRDARMCLSFPT
jgi:phosphate acetyltransferase